MSRKVLILLSILCAVNASIVINVYNDYDDNLINEEAYKDCNPRACDQLCRRLGFTGGVCVGDKCKCDNFLQRKANLPSDRYKYKVIQDLEECSSDEACAQICRKLGFPGGSCIGDKCNCNKLNPEEKAKTSFEKFWHGYKHSNSFEEKPIEPQRKLATCNDANCNTQCVLMGYRMGMCFVGYCQCYY